MSNVEQTLERLAQAFTAQNIMSGIDKLVCASNEAQALSLLKSNPSYDLIPILTNGGATLYLERGQKNSKQVNIRDLVSEATPILDLVDILTSQKFCFVLSNRTIAGLVHFSDLNNHLVKLPFFVILEALEQHLLGKVGPSIDENSIKEIFGQDKFDELEFKMQRLKKHRADLDWVNLLSFKLVVEAACHLGLVTLQVQEVRLVSEVRNLVAHADRTFVEKHSDISRLSETKRLCLSILGQP